jgi:putative hydrolase of the HAD superfamily
MTTIISFDLDGTIMTSDYADHVWLEGLPKIYAIEKKTTYEKAHQLLTHEYDTIGDHTPEWYDLSYWFTRYHLKTPYQQLLQQYIPYIHPYPDALDTIKHLATYYPLIITSNAKQEFIDIQLHYTNLTDYFTETYSSLTNFNQVKKHPAVYQQICDILQIPPSNLIHIGDHYEYDYLSPQKIGIQAYHLDRSKTHQKTKNTVYTLYEFQEKIQKPKATKENTKKL